jgi:diaminopimelate epimerase
VRSCHLYDAAGNKILWLDGGDSNGQTHFDQLRVTGRELLQRFDFGQEMTAILYGSPQRPRALFWNRDGTTENMCGNAIRCAAHFISNESDRIDRVSIETPHGHYLSRKLDANHGSVMIPAHTVRILQKMKNGDIIVDAGTPHRIRVLDREWPNDVIKEAIASSNGPEPINFNLVRQTSPFHFRVRIFERGVGETASCGTGAAAIVAALGKSGNKTHPHIVQFASGEQLTVTYNEPLESFEIGGRVKLLMASSIADLART